MSDIIKLEDLQDRIIEIREREKRTGGKFPPVQSLETFYCESKSFP